MPSPDYKRGQRVIAGKTGATGATGPMSDRAALVEEIAVEGLKIAERLDDEVLALSAQSSMTAAEVADIRRGLAEQWVDTLPNDVVWLTPEAGQAIRDSGVGQRVYDYWTSPGRGIASWAFDRDLGLGREGYDAWVAASDKWQDLPGSKYPKHLEKLFPAAQRDAARNLSHVAEEDAAIGLVRQVCIEVTAENGFSWWKHNFVVLWAKYLSTEGGLTWTSYYHPREGEE